MSKDNTRRSIHNLISDDFNHSEERKVLDLLDIFIFIDVIIHNACKKL